MKIILFGYGKMGKAIEAMATEMGHEVILIVTGNNAKSLTLNNIQDADVGIDFSTPNAAFANIKKCLEAGIPIVSGTTGWLDKMNDVVDICKQHQGTFLYGSNFSIGVNLFFMLNRKLAKIMDRYTDYKPSMEEVHHVQKLDAPSGTAISLAKDIINNSASLSSWKNEEKVTTSELPIISKRIDKVPGTHIISWDSNIDSIEIKHTAHSRAGFVKGALLAAEFVKDKKGIFGMQDVLELG